MSGLSVMQGSVPLPANGHASTSTTGPIANGIYQPPPLRAEHLPPFQRTDINGLKQELHDVLGDRGLPYWKALNGYLLGQLGRDELVAMVHRWLKGPQGTSTLTCLVVKSRADHQWNCTTDYCRLCCTMPLRRPSRLNHPPCLICENVVD